MQTSEQCERTSEWTNEWPSTARTDGHDGHDHDGASKKSSNDIIINNDKVVVSDAPPRYLFFQSKKAEILFSKKET